MESIKALRSDMSLKKKTRRWWRLARTIFLCTGVLFEIPVRIVVNVLSGRSNERDTLTAEVSRRLAQRVLSVLGVTVISPEPSEQKGTGEGCLLVSNHLGYLDVLIISAVYADEHSGSVGFVAKSEVAGWPLIGWLSRLGGTLFLERGVARSSVRSVYQVSRALRSGRQMHVFPEGTTTNGRSLATFHPLFFAAAIRAGRPVVPLTLRVEEVIEDGVGLSQANEVICWYGDDLFLTHFWRLLLIDSARIRLIEQAAVPASRVDRALGLACRVEETIRSVLDERVRPEELSDLAADDLPLDLFAGAVLFSLFVNPGDEITREMVPMIEECT